VVWEDGGGDTASYPIGPADADQNEMLALANARASDTLLYGS